MTSEMHEMYAYQVIFNIATKTVTLSGHIWERKGKNVLGKKD